MIWTAAKYIFFSISKCGSPVEITVLYNYIQARINNLSVHLCYKGTIND